MQHHLIGVVLIFNVYMLSQQHLLRQLRNHLSSQIEVATEQRVRAETFYELAILAPSLASITDASVRNTCERKSQAQRDATIRLSCCVVGDGEAETGPLAMSWHSNKFLNPVGDGAVLPILHVNGYKINNPAVLGRLSEKELTNLFQGYGYQPCFVEGAEPEAMHQLMVATLDAVLTKIQEIQNDARIREFTRRPLRNTD